MEVTKLIAALDKIIQGFQDFRAVLASETSQTLYEASANAPQLTIQSTQAGEDLDTFEKLKIALQSDRWPEALLNSSICDINSEDEKAERGIGIIEVMVEEDLKGLKFLDYGCGEGYSVVAAAKNEAELALGFDISPQKWDFPTEVNLKFTDDYETVKANGPYDVILMYDVIDHAVGELPTDLLSKAREVLKDDGKIYVRVHPFTSRHATHLYHDLNKAYIHLVFTPEELQQLIPRSKFGQPSFGVVFPLDQYGDFFNRTHLKVLHRRLTRQEAEPFFTVPKIAERIIARTKMSSFPEWQLSLQWIDYVLCKEQNP